MISPLEDSDAIEATGSAGAVSYDASEDDIMEFLWRLFSSSGDMVLAGESGRGERMVVLIPLGSWKTVFGVETRQHSH